MNSPVYDIVSNEDSYNSLNSSENKSIDYVNLSSEFYCKSKILDKELEKCKESSKKLHSNNLINQLIDEASQAYALGNNFKALEIYDQLLTIETTNYVLFANRSAILLKMNRYSEAIEQANCAIKLKSNWPKVNF